MPKTANVLWRWMRDLRVTCDELAKELGYTPQHLSDVRRGKRPPSDALMVRFAETSKRIEAARGVRSPRGVRISDWATDAAASRSGK